MTDSEKTESILNGLQSLSENMTLLKKQITALESNMKNEMQGMKSEMQDIKQGLKLTNLIIETEIRKAIDEGHFDLTRKLDDALKVEEKNTRLTVVKSKVEAIKEGPAQAAEV